MILTEPYLRKERSESLLREEGIPVDLDLPPLPDANAIALRTREEVAARAMALCLVAIRGEGLDQETTIEIARAHGIMPHLTPSERAFIEDQWPPPELRAAFVWRYEAYHMLLWALGYLEGTGRPDDICEVRTAVEVLVERSAGAFIDGARLRDAGTILDEADLVHRYHHAAEDALARGEDPPGGLNADVLRERERVMMWLIGVDPPETREASFDPL